MPFSEATLDFMALNRVMNSRDWFHEHRSEYLSLVVEPTAELVQALAPEMSRIDPSLVIDPRVGKSISRLWRDTRRGPELPLYRDVLWINLRRAKYEGYPGFWFEFSPRRLRWGCGWYQTDPATMDCARDLIKSRDPDWLAAYAAYEAQDVFALEDERYKRTRHPDAPEMSANGSTRRASALRTRKIPSTCSTPRSCRTGSPPILNASRRSTTSS